MEMPNFDYEFEFWTQGKLVAGLDEVGKGAFAGPVVAAAVVLRADSKSQIADYKQFSKQIIIDDSKKLTVKQRELAAIWIKENALYWQIGISSVYKINRYGIVKATHSAFRGSLKKIKDQSLNIEHLLIDGFYIPRVLGFPRDKQTAIIKGDQKSISIAAASIIAKVYRDNLMREFSKQEKYKPYLWQKNKGYGTKEHRNAISKYGATKLHRVSFLSSLVQSSA